MVAAGVRLALPTNRITPMIHNSESPVKNVISARGELR
jgi:hypothetical protein